MKLAGVEGGVEEAATMNHKRTNERLLDSEDEELPGSSSFNHYFAGNTIESDDNSLCLIFRNLYMCLSFARFIWVADNLHSPGPLLDFSQKK